MTWTGGSRIWTGADSLGSVDMDEAAARGLVGYRFINVPSAVSRGMSTVLPAPNGCRTTVSSWR